MFIYFALISYSPTLDVKNMSVQIKNVSGLWNWFLVRFKYAFNICGCQIKGIFFKILNITLYNHSIRVRYINLIFIRRRGERLRFYDCFRLTYMNLLRTYYIYYFNKWKYFYFQWTYLIWYYLNFFFFFKSRIKVNE